MFYSNLTREFFGRMFASYQFPDLVGSGLQDNSNVYAHLSESTMWRKVRKHDGSEEGGDGGQMLSLRTGKFVLDRPFNDERPKAAVWDPSKRIFEVGEPIEVRSADDSATVLAKSLPLTAMEVVNNPQYFNKKNQKMYAVGVSVNRTSLAKVFGLFSDDDGSDMHWEPIIDSTWDFDLDHNASSIGSGDGRVIFFATHKSFSDARIYRL